MGGIGNYIKGKTKLETYKRFREQVNRQEVEERTGLFMDAGEGNKLEVFKQMKKDPDTNEWVLFYHFGK